MRDLASIQKIKKIRPIEGADKIEVAQILGWDVIIQKGTFEVGDLCVYIEYDTVLPEKLEFEFLRSRCYNSRVQGFRIRNMKMKGVYSQGIVFGLDILPKTLSVKSRVEGLVVADILEIRRYEQKTKQIDTTKLTSLQRLMLQIKGPFDYNYPVNIEKSDEPNVQVCYNKLVNEGNMLFSVTEKLEGQAATYSLDGRKYKVFSHNKLRIDKDNNWYQISEQYQIKKALKSYRKKHGFNIAIQGEILGPGIQKNIYGLETLAFFVYNVRNLDTYKDLVFEDMFKFCEETGLTYVPCIEQCTTLKSLGKSVGELLEYSEGKSLLNEKVKREGIVIRGYLDPRVSAKIKSRSYELWFNKKDKE